MDDSPSETPEFESTATTAGDGEGGSDALQLGPADAPPAAVEADDAFAIDRPAQPKTEAAPSKPVKPAKAVSAASNASVVAALMGKSIAKPAKPGAAARSGDATTSVSAVRPPQAAIPATASAGVIDPEPRTPLFEPSVAATPSDVGPGVTPALESPAEPSRPARPLAAAGRVGGVSVDRLPTPSPLVDAEPLAMAPPVAGVSIPRQADAVVNEDVVPAMARASAASPVVAGRIADYPAVAPVLAVALPPTTMPAERLIAATSARAGEKPATLEATAVPPAAPAVRASAVPPVLVPVVTPLIASAEPPVPPARIVPRVAVRPVLPKPPTPMTVRSPAAVAASSTAAASPDAFARVVRPRTPMIDPPRPAAPRPAPAAGATTPHAPTPVAVRPVPAPPSGPRPVGVSSPTAPAVRSVPAGPTGAWWTIPLTVLGIATVACSVLVPASDETRRDAHELAKIEQDVAYFEAQSWVNADFLNRIETDATLAERLALRQLHQTRPNVRVAPTAGPADRFAASPFALTRLDPPAPLPPYRPVPGKLGEWFLGSPRPQQMAALGILVTGAGVLLGGSRRRPVPSP